MATPDAVRRAIEEARARLAKQKEVQARKDGDHLTQHIVTPVANAVQQLHAMTDVQGNLEKDHTWNNEQYTAITYGLEGKSFCLIGAAGTGKTTTLRGLCKELLKRGLAPPLETNTKWLEAGSPGIVLLSFTRRAVRNIAKQMPEELKNHCLTFHKILEYAPVPYEVEVEDKDFGGTKWVTKIRFEPTRNKINPLPRNIKWVVIDEASMVDTELMEQFKEATRHRDDIKYIVLGDLNQLPPVFGRAILGRMLLTYPVIELTQVYRQAQESPIISLAYCIKNNNYLDFNKRFNTNARQVETKLVIEKEGNGKVTLHPWKIKWEADDALQAMQSQINAWIKDGTYDPDQDIILCPWTKKDTFSAYELNISIANTLGVRRKADVYEVIAGFNTVYLAVGDKVMVDKQDAVITKITRNHGYIGKSPRPHSPNLNRWGHYSKKQDVPDELVLEADELSDAEIDDMLEAMGSPDDKTNKSSHIVTCQNLDTGEEFDLTSTGAFAPINFSFGYAMTVHKAQGSEWRRVFFITHWCHAQMLSRELVYTALTRAAQELYVVMSPHMLSSASAKPRIKGDTLKAKLAWYEQQEKQALAASNLKKQQEQYEEEDE